VTISRLSAIARTMASGLAAPGSMLRGAIQQATPFRSRTAQSCSAAVRLFVASLMKT
jgi:hypothetical protein